MGMGYDGLFSVESNGVSFDANSLSWDFHRCTISAKGEHLDAGMITGTRSMREDRSRDGIIRVGGQLEVSPSYRFLDFFLPYILGAAESADTFDPADTLPAFDCMVDYGNGAGTATLFTYLVVNRMSLRFAPGILRMTLDLVGKTETINQTYAGAALGVDDNVVGEKAIEYNAMVFHDLVVTMQSGARDIDEGELVIDNQLETKFYNSQTAQQIRPTDRTVTLGTTHPASVAVLTDLGHNPAGVDATLVLSRSNMTSTINLYNLKAPRNGPVLTSKGETTLGLVSQARGDDANLNEISWVNDPVDE